MRISSKPDPLSADEKRSAKIFLKEAFEKGFARYPFGNNRLVICKDGRAVWIYTDGRWSISTEYIYVGHREDAGTGEMENPGNRLAVMVALMGACDLQTDAELLSLFEKRLAAILAGVYSSAIAPLAVRSNDEPIARMAWSAEGGVAAFIDGEWITPITGEKVQVGEGWSVVETGEGRPQPAQAVPVPVPVVAQSRAEEFARIVAQFGTLTTPDGRLIVTAGANSREDIESNWLTSETFRPHTWMIADQYVNSYNAEMRWGVTYPREDLAVVQSSQQAEGRQLLREDFDRWVEASGGWIITQTNDGRPIVAFGSNEQYVRDGYLTQALREGGPNVEVAQNTLGNWGIAPVWGPVQAPVNLSSEIEVPTLGEANRQLRAAVDAAGVMGRGSILDDGRQAWACIDEASARAYLSHYQVAAPIPHAVVENLGRNSWYVVSMPASQLSDSF